MIKNHVWIILIVSLCGFQFGYNTAVISGSILFISKAFSLSTWQEGNAASIILIGALIGASLSGVMANRLGRRRSMQLAALMFLIGSLVAALPGALNWFLAGRVIQGLGVGSVSVLAPMYLAEFAPAAKRGAYVSINQLALSCGVLVAYSCNLLFAESGNWEKMIGLGIVPATIQFIALFFVPETHKKAPQVASKPSWHILFQPMFRKTLLIGVLLSLFQQITGINAVIYFAPTIFEASGFSSAETAIFATLGVGSMGIIVTSFAVKLIDKVGRRPLLIWGTVGMIVTLLLVGISLQINSHWVRFISVASLMAYVAFFSIGMGTVLWIIIAEIFPAKIKEQAMSLSIFFNWVGNYVVALTFLDLAKVLTFSGAFFLYAAISLLALLFIWKKIPETKCIN